MKLILATPQEHEALLILHKSAKKRSITIALVVLGAVIFLMFLLCSLLMPTPPAPPVKPASYPGLYHYTFLDDNYERALDLYNKKYEKYLQEYKQALASNTGAFVFFLVVSASITAVYIGFKQFSSASVFKNPLYYCTGVCVSREVIRSRYRGRSSYTFQLKDGPRATFVNPPHDFELDDTTMFIYDQPEHNFTYKDDNYALMYCRSSDFASTLRHL